MSSVSLTRLTNFDQTKTNLENWRRLATEQKYARYDEYFNAEEPRRQSMIMTGIEAGPCCFESASAGGCLLGTVCEGTGALIDCCLTTSTCGSCNAQLLSEDGDDIEEEGSGCFQGCLGAVGNVLGNCLGSVFACVPYMLTYAICLPKNCCRYYCCPPTQEEKNRHKQKIEQEAELLQRQEFEKAIEADLGPGGLNLWRQLQNNSTTISSQAS